MSATLDQSRSYSGSYLGPTLIKGGQASTSSSLSEIKSVQFIPNVLFIFDNLVINMYNKTMFYGKE